MKHNLQFTPDMSLDAVLRATQKWAATGDLGIPSWKKNPTKLDPTTFGISPSMVNTGTAVKALPGEDLGISRAKVMSPANPVVAPFNGAVQSGAQIAKQQDAELQAHDAAVNSGQQPGELSAAAQYAERRAAYVAKYSGKELEIGAQVAGGQSNRPSAFLASPNGAGAAANKGVTQDFSKIKFPTDRNNPTEWNPFRDTMSGDYRMDNAQIDTLYNWNKGAGTANTYNDFAKSNPDLAGKMFSKHQDLGELTGNIDALTKQEKAIVAGNPDQQMTPGTMGRALGGKSLGYWTNNGVVGERPIIGKYVHKDYVNQQSAADQLKANSGGAVKDWRQIQLNRAGGYNDPKHVATVRAADQTQRLQAGAGGAAPLWKASEEAASNYEKAVARVKAAANPTQTAAYTKTQNDWKAKLDGTKAAYNKYWSGFGLNGGNITQQNNSFAFQDANDPNKLYAQGPTTIPPVKPPTV